MVKQITNRYAGQCQCGRQVAAGQGYAQLQAKGGKWITVCVTCATGETPVPAEAPSPTATFPLTGEQEHVVDEFRQGSSLAVQAGAGTGKTSTLVAIGNSTTRTGSFVAFNKDIVRDAARKLPRNVTAYTAHKLAHQQVGVKYQHRLDSERQSSSAIALHLGIDPFACLVNGAPKVVQPSKLAGVVMQGIANFCNTADRTPGTRHLPYVDGIDAPTAAGARTFENNDALASHLADAIDTAWEDILSTEGTLRFNPDHFLKIWELGIHGAPRIPGEFIMLDEAQDLSPVMMSVVEQQGKQTVFVGDSQQAIYEWRGAVDALDKVPADSTCYLTNSFRFGPEIAAVANTVLGQIEGAVLRLTGMGKHGTVGPLVEPDAILCRTNAEAIRCVIAEMDRGRMPHLVGGGGEVLRFARAAKAMQAGRQTDHPELCIFTSWDEVVAYTANDMLGGDLAPMVKLVEDHGADTIIRAAGNDVAEEDAQVVISTAHKSKGREWDRVLLAGDFPAARMDKAEYRLLYVAVTRARVALDFTGCAAATDLFDNHQAVAR